MKLESRRLWISIETRRRIFHESKPRKNYTPEEKVAILKRHLVEKVPVSDLCDDLGLNPNVFYAWQKQFFENGAAAFQKARAAARSDPPRPEDRETRSEARPRRTRSSPS